VFRYIIYNGAIGVGEKFKRIARSFVTGNDKVSSSGRREKRRRERKREREREKEREGGRERAVGRTEKFRDFVIFIGSPNIHASCDCLAKLF